VKQLTQAALMSDRRYPADVEEIYYSTKSELELKLSEAEAFVVATNAKSFEVVVNAVIETTTLVGDFVKEKRRTLEKSWERGKASSIRLRSCTEEIAGLQAKLASLDKTRELNALKKESVEDLDREVTTLTGFVLLCCTHKLEFFCTAGQAEGENVTLVARQSAANKRLGSECNTCVDY
jgi:hypothetical protein